MATWFKRRRWRALVELIHQLPATSRTVEAEVNDPILAREIAEASINNDNGPAGAGSVRDETVTNDYLRSIEYRLGEIIRALAGGKGKQPKPRPRPVTAVEKLRGEVLQEKAEKLIAQFTPWAAG